MKANKTNKAITKAGTTVVIAVVDGEEDTEVDISISLIIFGLY